MQELAPDWSAITFLVQSSFPVKLKDISPPPPCWARWGENFPSTIGKLINKAGVKKLLLLVVFTPWRETPTQSIVLPQSVPFTYREEAGCAFLAPPPQHSSDSLLPVSAHTLSKTHTRRHTHIPVCRHTDFFMLSLTHTYKHADSPHISTFFLFITTHTGIYCRSLAGIS